MTLDSISSKTKKVAFATYNKNRINLKHSFDGMLWGQVKVKQNYETGILKKLKSSVGFERQLEEIQYTPSVSI